MDITVDSRHPEYDLFIGVKLDKEDLNSLQKNISKEQLVDEFKEFLTSMIKSESYIYIH